IIVRSLLLLFLILLLARPVVKGYFRGWVGAEASTISVVIVDDSFSMSGQAPLSGSALSRSGQASNAARRASAALESISSIVSDQSGHGRAIVLRSSDGKVIYEGPAASMATDKALAAQYEPGYGRDNLGAVLDTLLSAEFRKAAQLYANRELFIVSDFQTHQQRTLGGIGRDTTFWADWHVFLLPAPPLENNVAVVRAEVETAIPLVGELMDVSVTLRNTGQQTKRNVPVQIVLNDIRSGQSVVDLRPGEQKTVAFQVAPSSAGHQQGYAESVRDERIEDNRYYFHAYIPRQVRTLLIEPAQLDPSFPKLALRSLAGESPQIQLRVASPTDLNWVPKELEVVILNGLEAVPHLLRQQLSDFLDEGGTLIVIPGADGNGAQTLTALLQQFGLPAMALAAQEFNSPLSIDGGALKGSILRGVFRREAELDELPEVLQLFALHPRGEDETVLWATGKKPVLTRSSYANGSAFLFALPFHLMWTDMPLKGSFIPLWHRLVYWRASSPLLADVRVADRPVLEIKPRQATQSVTLTSPGGVTSLLNPDIRTRTVTLGELHQPGIYALSSRERRPSGAGGRQEEDIQFRVNIAKEELTGGTLSVGALKSLLGPSRAFILEEGAMVEEWINDARFGRELWRPLLYLVLMLIVLEMVLGNVYQAPRRSEPVAAS
ncbi:MAG: CARDB domain-containing protein, partial [Candidatus Neomarinimicrobiota bacterium]